ncbi:CLUMA_CG018655, isoform A [Clunio marinus]|uniref:CLUMA_CG018655, isoform A n=1 Tax=Clunio marinus TaxID=568069 RepID=A0A1J1IZL0_9DIPT|nr:CLUMA_CG018655, isoform A [Clunio marinus]
MNENLGRTETEKNNKILRILNGRDELKGKYILIRFPLRNAILIALLTMMFRVWKGNLRN